MSDQGNGASVKRNGRPGPQPAVAKNAPFTDCFTESLNTLQRLMKFIVPGRTVTVIWVANDRALREKIRTGGGASMPFIALQLQTVADPDAGLPAKNLQRTGVATKMNDTKTAFAVINPVPVSATIKTTFIANDFPDVVDYLQAWKWAEKSGQFRFELKVHDVALTFHPHLSSSLDIPDLGEDDVENYYEFVSTIVLDTYVAKMSKVGIVRTVTVVTQDLVTGSVLETDDIIVPVPDIDRPAANGVSP